MAVSPETQTVPVSQARQKFGELINQVYKRQTRVIIEKNGLPAVALVAISDLERWVNQEHHGGPAETGPGDAEQPLAPDRTALHAPSRAELIQRQALVNKILANAEKRVISPRTTTDLIQEAREGREQFYERGTR